MLSPFDLWITLEIKILVLFFVKKHAEPEGKPLSANFVIYKYQIGLPKDRLNSVVNLGA